jgi:hypothetical protein
VRHSGVGDAVSGDGEVAMWQHDDSVFFVAQRARRRLGKRELGEGRRVASAGGVLLGPYYRREAGWKAVTGS